MAEPKSNDSFAKTPTGMPGDVPCAVCGKPIHIPVSTIWIMKDGDFADTDGVRVVLQVVCTNCQARQPIEWAFKFPGKST